MDPLESAAQALVRGAVLQIIPPFVPVRKPRWRRWIGERYERRANNLYPEPGQVRIDPGYGAHMGVRADDVRHFVTLLHAVKLDVLVLTPIEWDDTGKATRYAEAWYRAETVGRPLEPRLGRPETGRALGTGEPSERP